MVIEYERLKTGIVDNNLSLAEEPVSEARGGDTASGFMAECYLGPRATRFNDFYAQRHAHYREHYS
jgi:hypothetical protein